MSEEIKHTAGPFEIARHGETYDDPASIYVVGPLPGRLVIAEVTGDDEQAWADAKFLCCAANTHDDLLAALTDIMDNHGLYDYQYDNQAYCGFWRE